MAVDISIKGNFYGSFIHLFKPFSFSFHEDSEDDDKEEGDTDIEMETEESVCENKSGDKKVEKIKKESGYKRGLATRMRKRGRIARKECQELNLPT